MLNRFTTWYRNPKARPIGAAPAEGLVAAAAADRDAVQKHIMHLREQLGLTQGARRVSGSEGLVFDIGRRLHGELAALESELRFGTCPDALRFAELRSHQLADLVNSYMFAVTPFGWHRRERPVPLADAVREAVGCRSGARTIHLHILDEPMVRAASRHLTALIETMLMVSESQLGPVQVVLASPASESALVQIVWTANGTDWMTGDGSIYLELAASSASQLQANLRFSGAEQQRNLSLAFPVLPHAERRWNALDEEEPLAYSLAAARDSGYPHAS